MQLRFPIYACVAALAVPVPPLPQDLSSARAAAAALPRMHSLLVSHRGRLALEYYAPGHRATRLANIKSASKSVISTLVGIAIEHDLIPGVREPIVRWLPELRKDADPRKHAITIEDIAPASPGGSADSTSSCSAIWTSWSPSRHPRR